MSLNILEPDADMAIVLFKKLRAHIQVRRISSLLPGANCTACGSDDCRGFAKGIVRDRADVSRCVVCDEAMIRNIREYLYEK